MVVGLTGEKVPP